MIREPILDRSVIENPIQTQHTSPATANGAATDFLLDHVGEVGGGTAEGDALDSEDPSLSKNPASQDRYPSMPSASAAATIMKRRE